jgi:hypothetical protein
VKVRDEIAVSRVAGLDVPRVFELEDDDRRVLGEYLAKYGLVRARDVSLCEAAFRLAERGIPQGITFLVRNELLARGRLKEAALVAPFVVVGVK